MAEYPSPTPPIWLHLRPAGEWGQGRGARGAGRRPAVPRGGRGVEFGEKSQTFVWSSALFLGGGFVIQKDNKIFSKYLQKQELRQLFLIISGCKKWRLVTISFQSLSLSRSLSILMSHCHCHCHYCAFASQTLGSDERIVVDSPAYLTAAEQVIAAAAGSTVVRMSVFPCVRVLLFI